MSTRTIQRVLVACRGEAGASIARRLEAAGIETVCAYAEADAADAWLDEVAYASPLTSATPDPYTDGMAVLSAALDGGCDAVHPGIGALARAGEQAHMILNVGLAWIGCPPTVLEGLDRAAARARARELGLPAVPQSPTLHTLDEGRAWIARHPGALRYVTPRGSAPLDDLDRLLTLTGPPYVLEHAIPARRVTVGVIADGSSAIHLGDHECTLNRSGRTRVRESPAPALDAATREHLCHAAVRLAEGLNLVGVAGVEFLVDGARWWVHDVIPGLFEGYTLHDEVYGLELAPSQVRIASGETLGWEQSEIHPSGVGIELLVCATGTGTLDTFSLPEEASTSLGEGATVDPARDPVLARVTVTGPMRHAVLVRARATLGEIEVEGVPTDTPLLQQLLSDTRMWEGHVDTELLDRLDREGV